MTRGRKLKRERIRRRENGRRLSVGNNEKANEDKLVAIASIFKNDELQEIQNIVQISELDDKYTLIGAVVLGKFDVVKKLIKDGFPINYIIEGGVSALMWAIKVKQFEMAELLLNRGADIFQQDGEGNDAIMHALSASNWDQDTFIDFWNRMKALKYDLNRSNNVGNTLLHLAVKRQWVNVIELFLESGANVNSVTNKGATPLMLASSKHHCHTVNVLVKHNADITIEDKNCCTALCYAIAYMIRRRFKKPNSVLETLIGSLSHANSKMTTDVYLKKRLELLNNPPEETFTHTLAKVIVHVITYFVRFIEMGAEMLIRRGIFRIVKESMEKRIEDGEYMLGLVNILIEMLRYCDCCTQHVPREAVFNAFIDADLPNTCLRVLRRSGTMASFSNVIHPLFLPLALTCSQNSMKCWLQKNFRKYAHLCRRSNHTPVYNYFPDERHSQMVRKSSLELKSLLARLQKGETIYTDNLKPNKTRGGGAFSAKDFRVREVKVLKKIHRSAEGKDKRQIESSQKEEERGEGCVAEEKVGETYYWPPKKRAGEESSGEEPKGSEGPLKRSRWWDELSEGCLLFGIVDDDEEVADEWLEDALQEESKRHPPVETNSEAKCEPQAENNFQPQSEATCELHIETEYQAQLDMKSQGEPGCQFGSVVDYPAGFETRLGWLLAEFGLVVEWLKRLWHGDVTGGYSDAPGGPDDLAALYRSMPRTESYLLQTLTTKWDLLLHQLKISWRSHKEDTFALLGELQKELWKFGDNLKKVEGKTDRTAEKPPERPNGKRRECGEEMEREDAARCRHVATMSGDTGALTCQPEREHAVQAVAAHNQPKPRHPSPPGFPQKSHTKILQQSLKKDRLNLYSSWRLREAVKRLRDLPLEQCQFLPEEDLIIAVDYLQFNYKISQGGNFGHVVIGLDVGSFPVAVKQIARMSSVCSHMVVLGIQELLMGSNPLIKLRHDYLLPYSHCTDLGRVLLIATPLCENNIRDHLYLVTNSGVFDESTAYIMVKQLLLGLHFLHSQRPEPVIHGNLKPTNVMVDSKGNLRLAEFGLQKVLYQLMSPPASSIIWWANETYSHFRSTWKLLVTMEADIQVAGMMAHYLATGGVHAFGRGTAEEVVDLIAKGRPQLHCNQPEATDLVAWMVMHNPANRPNTQQTLRHIYLWTPTKKWRFVLLCSGISSNNSAISFSVDNFHKYLDHCTSMHNIHTRWMSTVKSQLGGLMGCWLDDYTDNLSGLLRLVRNTLPSSSHWFLKIFPCVPLILFRLLENTFWLNTKDFAPFTRMAS